MSLQSDTKQARAAHALCKAAYDVLSDAHQRRRAKFVVLPVVLIDGIEIRRSGAGGWFGCRPKSQQQLGSRCFFVSVSVSISSVHSAMMRIGRLRVSKRSTDDWQCE